MVFVFVSLLFISIPVIIFFEQISMLLTIRFQGLSLSNLFGDRVDLWNVGIKIIKENPYFGVGLNNSPLALDGFNIVRTTGRNLHNYYLENIANFGLMGFTLIFLVWIYMISCFKRIKYFSSSITIALISLLVVSFSTNVIDQFFVYLPLVLIFSLSIHQKNRIIYK